MAHANQFEDELAIEDTVGMALDDLADGIVDQGARVLVEFHCTVHFLGWLITWLLYYVLGGVTQCITSRTQA